MSQEPDKGVRAGIVYYALVLSAVAMMLVNAATMESPVKTVSRTAANAAAAIIPIAHSIVDVYGTACGRPARGTGKSPTRTSPIANPLNIRLAREVNPYAPQLD